MRKLLWIGLVLVGFAISACSTPDGVSDQTALYQRASQVCGVYKNTLNTLAVLRAAGQLSEGQITAVNDIRPLFAVCRPGGMPENLTGDWIALLDAALFELMLVEGSK